MLLDAFIHLYILVCNTSVLIFRASYDTSAPNVKRKSQDEGETDEDKMEEYKASGDLGNLMVKKKKVLPIMSLGSSMIPVPNLINSVLSVVFWYMLICSLNICDCFRSNHMQFPIFGQF